MPRVYLPSEKHKHPKGHGTICPKMPQEDPAKLLNQAVPVAKAGLNKLWAASGRWCFCAHPSPQAGPDCWHGFPVVGGEVPEPVLAALCEAGQISMREVRQLRKQRALPEAWP